MEGYRLRATNGKKLYLSALVALVLMSIMLPNRQAKGAIVPAVICVAGVAGGWIAIDVITQILADAQICHAPDVTTLQTDLDACVPQFSGGCGNAYVCVDQCDRCSVLYGPSPNCVNHVGETSTLCEECKAKCTPANLGRAADLWLRSCQGDPDNIPSYYETGNSELKYYNG